MKMITKIVKIRFLLKCSIFINTTVLLYKIKLLCQYWNVPIFSRAVDRVFLIKQLKNLVPQGPLPRGTGCGLALLGGETALGGLGQRQDPLLEKSRNMKKNYKR